MFHSTFRFGADYYPEHWPEERWAFDAKLMQEAGFNTVRLAEFAWSRLEPNPGQFDFGWLDHAIDILADHGIDAVLGTPTASPAPWVMALYPDAYLVQQDGHRRTYGHRRLSCPTHAGYRERSRIITEAMAKHYLSNPAVIGWQMDNEFGERCFCDHCRRSFHTWLQNKYGDLDTLNDAWGTIFWSHLYTEWSQIPAPLDTTGPGPSGSPNPGLGLDYYRFISDCYVRFQNEQYEILHHWCPHHFVTHNLMGFNYELINYFELSNDLDFVAWDNYQRMQWTMGLPITPSGPALSHDTMRSLKQKPFWVMEQQSGSGGWDTVGEAVRPGELSLWAYQAIARGADGMIFFRWRTARFGTEQYWHGILDHHGVPGRRYQEVKRMGQELAQIGEQIVGATVKAEAAMLLSHDSRFAFHVQPNNPGLDYNQHCLNIYSALFNRNVSVDIVSPHSELDGYKLLFVPALYVLEEETARRISAFVKAGGTLVVTPRSGVKDGANTVVNTKLPGLLAEVCGVVVEEYDSLPLAASQPLIPTEAANGINGTLVSKIWCDILQPTTAETIAVYSEDYHVGRAAVTRNRHGEGTTFYIGTFGDSEFYDALMPQWLDMAGIESMTRENGIEIARRWQGDRALWFVLNHTAEMQTVSVPEGLIELLDHKANVKGELDLPPHAVRIFAAG